MAEGNRKDPRARVLNMTVRYKSATVDEFIENHSHDISKGGIFIKTRSPFPAGTLLKFEVRIAEDQRLMQGVGRVVWRREPERAEENFPAGMGIKFIKTAEGAAELISQIIAAREGAESSFDAGVRESGVAVSGPPISMPPLAGATGPNDSGRPTMPGPGGPDSEQTPALLIESGPRSWPIEAETIVTSPPKKRPDQAPDKRKVVLQGSALENPASSKPAPAPATPSAPEERAPSRAHSRQGSSIAEETTSPRARPAMSGAPRRSTSPSVYALVAILGIVALGVVLLNRSRSADTEEVAPPVSAVAPAPAAPPEPPPVPAAPEPSAAEPSTVQAEPTTTVAAQEPPAVSAPSPAPPPAPAVAAPAPVRTPPPVAAVPSAKPASPPVAAAPVVARPAATAKPKAPPAQPPSEGVAIIKPSDESLPPAPSAAPPVAETPSADKPPEKKKAAAAPPPQQAAPPAAPAPAAPPPATPPAASSPASDDNPY